MGTGAEPNGTSLERERALETFREDIGKGCLEPLSRWTNEVNVFRVLRLESAEIRHSNMIAWLLDPAETHGLGDSVLRGFLRLLANGGALGGDVPSRLPPMDLSSFVVLRERRNMDLVIVSRAERLVVCVENKVWSGEHDEQLARYKAQTDEDYPGFDEAFVFLTPDGAAPEAAEDRATWKSVGYRELVGVIEAALGERDVPPEARLLVRNYIDIVRSDIVTDKELEQACQEIYQKHRVALDLIFEHRLDLHAQLEQILVEWCLEREDAGDVIYSPVRSASKRVRFKTPGLLSAFPDIPGKRDSWGMSSYWSYELVNDDGTFFRLDLTLNTCKGGNGHDPIPEERLSEFQEFLRVNGIPRSKRLAEYAVINPLDPGKKGGWRHDLYGREPESTREEIRSTLDQDLERALAHEATWVSAWKGSVGAQ